MFRGILQQQWQQLKVGSVLDEGAELIDTLFQLKDHFVILLIRSFIFDEKCKLTGD